MRRKTPATHLESFVVQTEDDQVVRMLTDYLNVEKAADWGLVRKGYSTACTETTTENDARQSATAILHALPRR